MQLGNCYFNITERNIEKRDDGKFRLVTNRSNVYSGITLDEEAFGCAAIWLRDHNVSCGAMRNMQEEAFNSMRNEARSCFEKGQINEIKSTYKTNTFRIGYSGDPEKLQSALNYNFELIEDKPDHEMHTATIRLKSEIRNNDLLEKLLPVIHIHSFNEVIPGMNDVFIRVVQETNKN